jgi:hypothetical protein
LRRVTVQDPFEAATKGQESCRCNGSRYKAIDTPKAPANDLRKRDMVLFFEFGQKLGRVEMSNVSVGIPFAGQNSAWDCDAAPKLTQR